jgi:hypothetical protein
MNLSPYRAMGCDGPVTLTIQPVAKQTTSLSLYTDPALSGGEL